MCSPIWRSRPSTRVVRSIRSRSVGYDVLFADAQEPRRFGRDGEFFASGRLDNLSSVHAGLCALERYVAENADEDSAHTVMLAGFDHEEIGSETRSGAAGPFLEDVLVRLSQLAERARTSTAARSPTRCAFRRMPGIW